MEDPMEKLVKHLEANMERWGQSMDEIAERKKNRDPLAEKYRLDSYDEEDPMESDIVCRYLKGNYWEDIQRYIAAHIEEILPEELRDRIGLLQKMTIRDAHTYPVDAFHTDYRFDFAVTITPREEDSAPRIRATLMVGAEEDVSEGVYALNIEKVWFCQARELPPKGGSGIAEHRKVPHDEPKRVLSKEELKYREKGAAAGQLSSSDVDLLTGMPLEPVLFWKYLHKKLCPDMTQEEIADDAELSEAQITRTFNAKTRDYKYETVSKILLAMHCPPLTANQVLQTLGCAPNMKNSEHRALYIALHSISEKDIELIQSFYRGFLFGGRSKENSKVR